MNFAQLRLLALGWLGVTAALVAATVIRLTGSAPAGLLAAGAACLATKVFLSAIHFGTEYAIYVGTALTFFGLFRDWDRPVAGRLRWWPLAAGLAASALPKASFVLLAGLPLAIVILLWWAGRVRGPGPAYVGKAVAAVAFAARLSADPASGPPLRLTLGTADPTAVDVFVRRRPTTAGKPPNSVIDAGQQVQPKIMPDSTHRRT